jgi:hypothetical protein
MSDTLSTVGSAHSVVAHPQAMSLGQPVFILSAAMWHSWLEFVYADSDQYTFLSLRDIGRCDCGKSSIGYPHWPPSTVNEAFDQLNYLHNEHNTHRRHLAQRWWSFERAKASVHTDDNDDVPQVDSECTTLADHIFDTFKCIAIDMDKDMRMKPRARGWKCYEFCELVLHNKYSMCLCHCRHHRDECPTHSRQ